MPAKSKAQQRFFGVLEAYKKGKLKNVSKEIREKADSMSEKDIRDFAKTKHDGLPERVEQKSAAFVAGFLAKCASSGIDADVAGELYKMAYAVVRRPDGTLVQYGSQYGDGTKGTPMRADGTRGIVIGHTEARPEWARQQAAKQEAEWRRANGIPNGISTEEAVAIKRRNLERARKEWSDTSTAYGRDNAVVNRYRAPDDPSMSYDDYVANRDKYRTRVDPQFGESVAQSVKAPQTAEQILAASRARAQSPANRQSMAAAQRAIAENAQRGHRREMADWWKSLDSGTRSQLAQQNGLAGGKNGWKGLGADDRYRIVGRAYANRNRPQGAAAPQQMTAGVPKPPVSATESGADFYSAENTHSGRPARTANPPVAAVKPQAPAPLPGTPSVMPTPAVAGSPDKNGFWGENPPKSQQLAGYPKPSAKPPVAKRKPKPKAQPPQVGYNGIRSPWGNSVMYHAMS